MSAPSFAAAWGKYYEHLKLERGLRPATISLYRAVLYSWVAFVDPVPWEKAGRRHLGKWLDRRPTSPNARGPRLAANTKLQDAAVVTSFYRWAAVAHLVGRDRMAGFALPKAGGAAPRALDLSDVAKLLDEAEGDSRLLVMLWLCYGAGLRVGEVARCRVEDLRLGATPALLLVPEGKGGKSRQVPLAPPVVRVLRAHLARDGQRVGPLVEGRGRKLGGPMTPGSVSRVIADHMRACGVAESAHSLRHTYATELLKAAKGTNLYSVSKALGHSSTRTTESVYVLGYSGEWAQLAELLPDPRGVSAHA